VRASQYVGWFVGYLETKDNVYFFATNIKGSHTDGVKAKEISLEILKNEVSPSNE
jgi:beta-lactamase class D